MKGTIMRNLILLSLLTACTAPMGETTYQATGETEADCLPSTITEDTLVDVLDFVSPHPEGYTGMIDVGNCQWMLTGGEGHGPQYCALVNGDQATLVTLHSLTLDDETLTYERSLAFQSGTFCETSTVLALTPVL